MIYSFENKTVSIFSQNDFPNGPPKQVILMLSGGLDSAILFYIICKYYPEVEVLPATGKDLDLSGDSLCAKDIVSFMKEQFPDAKILQHSEYIYKSSDPLWIKQSKELFNDFEFASVTGLSTHLQQTNGLKKIREQTGISLFVNAVTANPPIEEMKLHNFLNNSDRYRNTNNEATVTKTRLGGTMYKPWVNIDKRFIAHIYNKEKITQLLYPLTKSCISEYSTYENRHCGTCWWCKEREWGFL